MNNERIAGIARNLKEAGVPRDFGPDGSRLLIRVWGTLAKGSPVTGEQVDEIAADLGLPKDDAHQFLRQVTERDARDNIIGIMGLSLNTEWVHRFYINGTALRTWCAWDALFLPPMLKQTATIESHSPVTKEEVRLTVSPERVEEVSPAGAVVSIVTINPDKVDVNSIEEVWSTFCHQIYFFSSREEAEQWSADRDDIAILSVEEAYQLGKECFSELLAYA